MTIQVQQLPDAVDDGLYTVLEGGTLTVPADGLLDNDILGFPTAQIVSFGASDATATAAGNSIALAGGSLTVNADGSFELATPTTGGQYSFLYRLENGAGFDDATVTIEVQRAPDAVDDGPYVTTIGVDINVVAPGLLANDDTGFPTTGIDNFGGGSLGGLVTDNAAGASVAFAGGTLTVNPNGSFSLTNPMVAGDYTVDYRLSNPAGTSDATVTIQVQGPPTAVDDGPAAASAPGDLFHTALNTTLDSTATGGDDNLLSNDTPGFPAATISSFGGGDLGGAVTNNAAGSTVTPLTGETTGSLTVNADGSFSFTPPTGFTGLYTFDYRLTNSAGSSDATVTIAVGVRPAATDDSYLPTVLGNVSIDTTTSSSFSVPGNDSGDGLTIIAFDAASANGGDVVVNADGTFSYDPPVGYEGSDSFSYTIDNGFSDPQSGTVSLTVSGMIWFIDVNDPTPNGDGRLSDPFDCLVSATCFSTVASDGAGDTIFLASGAYTGGLTLLANQFFIGEGATASISAISGLTPPADSPALPATNGTRPQLTTTNADGITLGSGNTIRGLNVGNTGTGTGITGSNFGTLTLSEVTVSGTGRAVSLTTGTAAVTFDAITVTSSTSQGINLNGVNGSFTVSGAVDIDSTTNEGIRIQNATSGTTSFTGAVSTTTGAQAGVSLTSNGGHSITFSGGLDIDTTSGAGFNATGGGTVEVLASGVTNTVDSTTGTAVNIQNTTIGVQDVTFKSISVNGAATGINLASTGSSGGLKVTGNPTDVQGGDASGGTIQNTTSDSIIVNDSIDLQLKNMTISNPTGDAMDIDQVSGTSRIDNVTVTDVDQTNTSAIRWLNTGRQNLDLTIENSSFTNSATGQSLVLIQFQAEIGTTTVQVQDSLWNNNDPASFQIDGYLGSGTETSGTLIHNFLNNTIQDVSATGTGDTNHSCGGALTCTYDIANNSYRNLAKAGAFNSGYLNAGYGGGQIDPGSTMVLTISGNQLSGSHASSVGNRRGINIINEGLGSDVNSMDVIIDNNVVDDMGDREALYISNRDEGGDVLNIDVTVTRNRFGTGEIAGTTANNVGGTRDAVFIEARAGTMNLLFGGSVANANTVRSDNDTSDAIVEFEADNVGSTLNATVTHNTFASTGTAPVEFELTNDGNAICLDLRDNNASNTGTQWKLDEEGGSFTVEGAGTGNVTQAQLQGAPHNNTGTFAFTGSVTNNNNTNCALPS